MFKLGNMLLMAFFKMVGAMFSAIFSLIGAIFSGMASGLKESKRARPKKQPKKSVVQKQRTQSQPNKKPQPRPTGLARVDKMEGHEFEHFTADLLRKLGYERVEVTPGSGDQGVDVIAVKDGKRYAIQCKRYGQKLGNKPVQEVHTGKQFYSCQVGVVITNNYFTKGAEDAARRVGVELWDRDTLIRKMGYRTQTASAG